MGILSKLFGSGKQVMSSELWARFALKQVLSPEWMDLRKQFFIEMKKQEVDLGKVAESHFLDELLAAQLSLLGAVCVHTHLRLGFEIAALLVKEYLPNGINDRLWIAKEPYTQKIAEYGPIGRETYEAIRDTFVARVGCKVSPAFAQRVQAELVGLQYTWQKDLSQYRFD